MENKYKRGSIYWLTSTSIATGSEQFGMRPVLIVSNDINNIHSPIVTVVAITSKQKPTLPVHVTIPGVTYKGVKNTVLCEQIFSVDKARLHSYKGELSPALMEKVDNALKIQLNFIKLPMREDYTPPNKPKSKLTPTIEFNDEYKLQFLKDAEALTDAHLAQKYNITANAARARKISWTTYFNNKNE